MNTSISKAVVVKSEPQEEEGSEFKQPRQVKSTLSYTQIFSKSKANRTRMSKYPPGIRIGTGAFYKRQLGGRGDWTLLIADARVYLDELILWITRQQLPAPAPAGLGQHVMESHTFGLVPEETEIFHDKATFIFRDSHSTIECKLLIPDKNGCNVLSDRLAWLGFQIKTDFAQVRTPAEDVGAEDVAQAADRDRGNVQVAGGRGQPVVPGNRRRHSFEGTTGRGHIVSEGGRYRDDDGRADGPHGFINVGGAQGTGAQGTSGTPAYFAGAGGSGWNVAIHGAALNLGGGDGGTADNYGFGEPVVGGGGQHRFNVTSGSGAGFP